MGMKRWVGSVAWVLGVMLVVPNVVVAQQQVPPQPQEQIEVTDDLLERFVEVYPGVVAVAQDAQTQLATAETAEEAQAIQQDAQERIGALLEDNEMSVQEYEAVVMRLNEDAELRAEVELMLAEKEDGGGVR